jgi:hypothetical protein
LRSQLKKSSFFIDSNFIKKEFKLYELVRISDLFYYGLIVYEETDSIIVFKCYENNLIRSINGEFKLKNREKFDVKLIPKLDNYNKSMIRSFTELENNTFDCNARSSFILSLTKVKMKNGEWKAQSILGCN